MSTLRNVSFKSHFCTSRMIHLSIQVVIFNYYVTLTLCALLEKKSFELANFASASFRNSLMAFAHQYFKSLLSVCQKVFGLNLLILVNKEVFNLLLLSSRCLI